MLYCGLLTAMALGLPFGLAVFPVHAARYLRASAAARRCGPEAQPELVAPFQDEVDEPLLLVRCRALLVAFTPELPHWAGGGPGYALCNCGKLCSRGLTIVQSAACHMLQNSPQALLHYGTLPCRIAAHFACVAPARRCLCMPGAQSLKGCCNRLTKSARPPAVPLACMWVGPRASTRLYSLLCPA